VVFPTVPDEAWEVPKSRPCKDRTSSGKGAKAARKRRKTASNGSFGLSKAVKGQAAQFDGILLNGATPDQFYDAQEPCFFFVAYGVYET
jgi:hypothetical protein